MFIIFKCGRMSAIIEKAPKKSKNKQTNKKTSLSLPWRNLEEVLLAHSFEK